MMEESLSSTESSRMQFVPQVARWTGLVLMDSRIPFLIMEKSRERDDFCFL